MDKDFGQGSSSVPLEFSDALWPSALIEEGNFGLIKSLEQFHSF